MWAVAKDKHIGLLECESMVDHVHLLIAVADRARLSKAMSLLKGTSSRRLFQRFPDLKHDAGTKNFWQHRYGARIVPEPAKAQVRHYIRTQWDRPEKYER